VLDDESARPRVGTKPRRLSAIDEGGVEPSTGALGHFPSQLPSPPSYPVAIDDRGRVADGHQVQGQPWFVLTSPAGGHAVASPPRPGPETRRPRRRDHGRPHQKHDPWDHA
jgi:hypothetical protein